MKMTIEISDNQGIKITGVKIKDKDYVTIRKFYRTKTDPEWHPSKQGITIEKDVAIDVVNSIKRVIKKDVYKELEKK